MAADSYDLGDWARDFAFLDRYVYPSESGYIPPDYLQEIEAYFQKHHPQDAGFRFERFSSALRFLVQNIDTFTVGGIAMRTSEAVKISDSLRFALWTFFVMPDKEGFDPNPDPARVLDVAEEADRDGS